MLRSFQILVSTIVLVSGTVSLSACGQQGSLYLPTDPAAANRATLPETLLRQRSANTTHAESINPAPNTPITAPAATPQ
jgi:predicted small lipoprotein YifL